MNDETLKIALMDSQNRVQSMSAIHETLYQSENLSSIDMNIYLSKLSRAVAQNYTIGSKTSLKIEAENILIGAKHASTIGLIINEMITNSFKYAFPDKQKGKIRINLQKTENQIELVYSDDGIGIPPNFDWRNTKKYGIESCKTTCRKSARRFNRHEK
jgi:two-component sensor histidine kinase